MYRCNNCNTNYNGGGYCPSCGTLLTEIVSSEINNSNNYQGQMNFNNQSNVPINDDKQLISNNSSNSYNNDIPNNNQNVANNEKQFDSVAKKDDKKYGVISIVIGAGGLIFYFFIGLSVWIALVLCSLGINMANKSKLSAPGLSKCGMILNIILGIVAIVMWILLLITSLI